MNLSTGKEPGTGQPGGGSKSEIDYFALGDSVASGHGLNDKGSPCHRSDNSYPHEMIQLLAKRYDRVNWHIGACSGATLKKPDPAEFKKSELKWFKSQVDYVFNRPTDNPTLVSITIGANDFEWANRWQTFQRLYYLSDDEYRKWVDATAKDVKDQLKPQVAELLSKPNVAVVITNYPNPFNEKSKYFLGTDAGNVCYSCHGRVEYAANRLTGAFLDIWVELGRPERLQITGIHETFRGHEAPRPSCGRASPENAATWIQHGDCIHPNEKGVQAITKLVNEDAIRLNR